MVPKEYSADPVVEPMAAQPVLEGESMAEERAILAAFAERLAERTAHHLGYPYNLDFDFDALHDAGLSRFSINNLGDPFVESNYGVHSRGFELGVLDWFADLWQLERGEHWGYVTNCGTEGNLLGLLAGREALPDGVLYASEASHYSVFKAARMFRMDAVRVATLDSGEIDCADLAVRLAAAVGRPAIVNVNIGTTVRGAVDDLDRVLATLVAAGYTEDRFYVHCDGALFGMMLPFLESPASPTVTFRKPIGSVSVSGHKFIGAPVPCGVVMTRRRHADALSREVEYINSRDATIMGSRNGHAPLYLWLALSRKGVAGFAADAERCLALARDLRRMLEEAGVRATLNERSSTVVFDRPSDVAFVRRWQLACEGDVAHVVVMPSTSEATLRAFANLFLRDGQIHEDGR